VRFTKALGVEAIGRGEADLVYVRISDKGVDYVLVGTVEGIGSASLAAMRRMLRKWQRLYRAHRDVTGEGSYPERVWVGLRELSESEFQRRVRENPDWLADSHPTVPPTSPAIYLDDEDEIWSRIAIRHEERPEPTEVRCLLSTYLERNGAIATVEIEELEEHEGRGFILSVDLKRSFPKGATVADAWRFAEEARALISAAEGGNLPRGGAVDLLRAGRWDTFVGEPESEWLEAKGDPYDHLRSRIGSNWRYELAKDVAAFANSPNGGLIVIGMVTKDMGDGDVISGRKEFDLKRVQAPAYRKHVAQLIYPQIDGFEVTRIDGTRKGYGLAVLMIPPQPKSKRPFLVRGALRAEKVMGSHLLWPVRQADETVLLDIAAVHDRLRLGDQVISGALRPQSR
jgi:hypothetical protein